MTTTNDVESLTRVGPGTPTGELMRQYWIPAAKSAELERDGDPTRLMLLGEKLIAFRDSAGRVGIMDHRCPHRCASLFLGRNEENGIRCVYHGWKYDFEGNCLEMPNMPADQDFKHKVKAKAYKVCERNGLVWVYMGTRAMAPPLPGIEATLLPEDDAQIYFAQRECNWLQALEGDIDTSHFSFLHTGSIAPDDLPQGHALRPVVTNRTPQYHVKESPWGTMYAAYRPADESGANTYWRFAHYLFPFWTAVPQGRFEDRVVARGWVPLDDTHTMYVMVSWRKASTGIATVSNGEMPAGLENDPTFLPQTTDWLGRWRLAGNATNDWLIDRSAQRENRIYSGISGGAHRQDQAVTESMGPVTDFAFEHLAPSDAMIGFTRRRLLRAVQALQESGTVPPGVDEPDIYLRARSGEIMAGAGENWETVYEDRLQAALRPGARQAAE
jgi:phenylpropionate dioxygenase-like ring-hydroxylating dioxygenase large terminal subunit